MRGAAWAMAVVLASVLPASAQEPPSPVLVIDQERLLAETTLGSDALDALEAQAKALTEENQRIEAELIAQERALTERRPTLESAEFRALADAFDERVQRIRAEQDEKARDLTRARDDARQSFFGEIGGIISDIVRERGAVVVLDRRSVFLSAERIDITDEAIARLNAMRAE